MSSSEDASASVDALSAKLLRAEQILAQFDGVLVAFSGGVDSSLLLALSLRAQPAEKVLAVTARGPADSDDDAVWADMMACELGAVHRVVPFDHLAVPGFAANPPERCYLCRTSLYRLLEEVRAEMGAEVIVDGAVADDAVDYRPGLRAAAEAGVRSPLAEAGLGKEEVRAACRQLGLAVAERPASPCLASRFPYGELITTEGLQMVARAEAFLRERGFPVVRVRHHGRLARVEVPRADIGLVAREPMRGEVVQAFKGLGYLYVCMDLAGFRSGSLNEVLSASAASASPGDDHGHEYDHEEDEHPGGSAEAGHRGIRPRECGDGQED